VREGPKRSAVTKLSPKLALNRPKATNFKKLEMLLSDGWQTDLVEFCIRYRSGPLALANRRIQPLCHLSADGSTGNSGRRIEYSIKKEIEKAPFSRGISVCG
jgi:hypothetical protein